MDPIPVTHKVHDRSAITRKTKPIARLVEPVSCSHRSLLLLSGIIIFWLIESVAPNYGSIFPYQNRLFGTYPGTTGKDSRYDIDTHPKSQAHSHRDNLLTIPFPKYRPPVGESALPANEF